MENHKRALLSANGLAGVLLNQGLNPALCTKLADEEIDEEGFEGISAGVLRACGFKAGEIIQIMKFHPLKCDLEEEHEDRVSLEPSQQQRLHESNSMEPVFEESEKENQSSDDDNEDVAEAELREADSQLSKYFSAEEMADLNSYEKRNNYARLLRWRRCLEINPRASIKPDFVVWYEEKLDKQKKQLEKQQKTLTQPTFQQTQARHPGSSRVLRSIPTNQPFSASPSNSTSSGTMKTSTDAMPSCSSANSADTSETARAPADAMLRPSSDAIPSTSSEAVPVELDWDDMDWSKFQLKIDKIKSLKVDLPVFDLKATLTVLFDEGEDSIKMIIYNLAHGCVLSSNHRKTLFALLTNHLYFEAVQNPKELTPLMKEGFAKSFILAFPQYSSDLHEYPWAPIFDRKSGTGYIVNCSRKIQRKHRVRKSKPKKPRLDSNQQLERDDSFDDASVQYLAVLMPDRSERERILDGMARSFNKREKARDMGLSIKEMLIEYPHLKNYDGEVLREEFKRVRPDAEDLCKNLLQMMPKILALPVLKSFNYNCNDDLLTALTLVSQHLPNDVKKRGDSNPIPPNISDLVMIVKVGDSVDDTVLARVTEAQKNKKKLQPYLIFIKAVPSNKVVRSFLVLDAETVQLAGCGTIKAFQHLMMAYFVFNAEYPLGWRNTLHAISTLFFKVFEKRSGSRKDTVTPSEHELWLKLAQMK